MENEGLITFLTSPTTKVILVPILTVSLSFLLKLASKKEVMIDKNLFYLGQNLITTAILMLFIDLCNNIGTNQVIALKIGCLMFGAFVVAIITSLIIRVWGWETDFSKRLVLTWWGGIIIPNIIGGACLFTILYVLY